jgi:hypothetical protein
MKNLADAQAPRVLHGSFIDGFNSAGHGARGKRQQVIEPATRYLNQKSVQ